MQNIGGTVEILEAVRHSGGFSKVLFAASGNEVGRSLYLPMDEDHPLTPHNPYGFSKAAAELAMWAWRRAYGVPSVVLSTGVVVGPGMRREVFIFKWLWNALHGLPIVVEGGRQTRDVTLIDDVVDAWVRAIHAPAEEVVGQKFYVGRGEEIAVEDLFHHTLAVLHDPAYRAANAGALRMEWPRIPLPGWPDGDSDGDAGAAAAELAASAARGRALAALLDPETPVPGVTTGTLRPELAAIAVLSTADGRNMTGDDFAVTAGWGHSCASGIMVFETENQPETRSTQ